MDIKQLKEEISAKTGIPANLLEGDTEADMLSRARTLLDFRGQAEAKREKSAAEQFTDFFNESLGIRPHDEQGAACAALEEIRIRERANMGGYPVVRDGGNPYINGVQLPDQRSTAEQFSAYLDKKLAWYPGKGADLSWGKPPRPRPESGDQLRADPEGLTSSGDG